MSPQARVHFLLLSYIGERVQQGIVYGGSGELHSSGSGDLVIHTRASRFRVKIESDRQSTLRSSSIIHRDAVGRGSNLWRLVLLPPTKRVDAEPRSTVQRKERRNGSRKPKGNPNNNLVTLLLPVRTILVPPVKIVQKTCMIYTLSM